MLLALLSPTPARPGCDLGSPDRSDEVVRTAAPGRGQAVGS